MSRKPLKPKGGGGPPDGGDDGGDDGEEDEEDEEGRGVPHKTIKIEDRDIHIYLATGSDPNKKKGKSDGGSCSKKLEMPQTPTTRNLMYYDCECLRKFQKFVPDIPEDDLFKWFLEIRSIPFAQLTRTDKRFDNLDKTIMVDQFETCGIELLEPDYRGRQMRDPGRKIRYDRTAADANDIRLPRIYQGIGEHTWR